MAAWHGSCSACEETGSMKLEIGGAETIQAPVEALWKALNDDLQKQNPLNLPITPVPPLSGCTP